MYKKSKNSIIKHLDFIILDLLCLELAYILSVFFRCFLENKTYFKVDIYRTMIFIFVLMELLVMFLFSSMKNVLKRGYYRELKATLIHIFMVILFSILYLFSTKNGENFSRLILLSTGILYIVFAYPLRLLWKRYLRKSGNQNSTRALLIITTQNKALSVLSNVRNTHFNPFHIVGLVIVDRSMIGESIDGIPVVADLNSVISFASKEWVDEIFLDVSKKSSMFYDLNKKFSEMGLTVHRIIANSAADTMSKQSVEQIGNYTVLTTSVNMASEGAFLLKRLMDIAGGILGCLATGILALLVGPLIYLASPGPIFFSQERMGKNGRKFRIYKFRSMYMDAEERKKELMEKNNIQDGLMFKMDNDPRIIKGIGHFIRKTSIDEFPQFLNVLKGEMSLVGTRPPTVDEWEKYELHHRARLAIKPGLTGMWQISGRSEITDFEEVVRLDMEYIYRWNLGLDIKILLKTLQVVVTGAGSK